jgi:integral membrane protein (TIGR01906 family)
MKFHYSTALSWLVTVLTPLFLIGLAMRIMLAPWFLYVEYNMPYFPADEYGFTKADRLHWAPYALDYLINSTDISYLSDLKFEDGSPLYNERELSHMHDVKEVTLGGLRAWYLSLAVLELLGLWAWGGNWMQTYLHGLRRGGWMMIILAAGLGGFAAVAFWEFFTFFHSLFFEGDTWLFLFSDTLIRLFPMQFWQDVFIWVGVIVLGGALALAIGLKPKAN